MELVSLVEVLPGGPSRSSFKAALHLDMQVVTTHLTSNWNPLAALIMLKKYWVTFFKGIPTILSQWIRGILLVLLVYREYLPQKILQNCVFNIVWDFSTKIPCYVLKVMAGNHLLNVSVIGLVDGKLHKELKHLWKTQFQIGRSGFLYIHEPFTQICLETNKIFLKLQLKTLSKKILFCCHLNLI